MDDCLGELPVFPGDIYFKTAARAQPFDRPRRPGLRQRRQQVDFPCLTLQEHLRNRRRPAEVTINLKRRMGIQQIGKRASLQQVAQHQIGMVAVL